MLVFFAVSTLLFFTNTMYYTITLLVVVFISLSSLVSMGVIRTLSSLMLVIVYVGAMIIIIGYICAVSPNFVTSSSAPLYLVSVFIAVSYFICSPSFLVAGRVRFFSPVDYFYSPYGGFLFSTIVLMLFVTLLIVTSQYSSPKGPFRSV